MKSKYLKMRSEEFKAWNATVVDRDLPTNVGDVILMKGGNICACLFRGVNH